MPIVPVIPDSAPFTADQRAWLNGFLAGLFSHASVPDVALTPPPARPLAPLAPLAILFASQTGTSEKLAKRTAKAARERGFAPVVLELSQVSPSQLTGISDALVVTSTFGDGEPPDSAKALWQHLAAGDAPKLDHIRYSVCALGDMNYPHFCQFGKDLDARLSMLGAQRVHPRQDCDVDFERPFATWLAAVLGTFQPERGIGEAPRVDVASVLQLHSPEAVADDRSGAEALSHSKDRPYLACLNSNQRLSGPGSSKDVRHVEIAIEGSKVVYQVGDALGIWPKNCPALVERIVAAMNCTGEESVPHGDGETSLRLALLEHYEIGRISPALLEYFARLTQDAMLARLSTPGANGELTAFLRGRDLLDLLEAHPAIQPSARELVSLLRRLQPRLYSISSSPKAHPGEVHLTISIVRYQTNGRDRTGVATGFLADRCRAGARVPVYVHANAAFRPPPSDVPLIMIGPGTGVAPFRAFLEERRATGSPGRNWLFFGDQHAATDYLYRDELQNFLRDGLLTRLDLAWSRDHSEKIYVQNRMREAAAEMWSWLEEGASVYVCGDASRMAKDVDAALHQVIEIGGGKSSEAARTYVAALQAARRYQRDIY